MSESSRDYSHSLLILWKAILLFLGSCFLLLGSEISEPVNFPTHESQASGSAFESPLAASHQDTAPPCAKKFPKRLVSLAPSITEILFALDAGPSVVGVTTFCYYPPEVRQLPLIGNLSHPHLERILALHPDLVVGTTLTSLSQAKQLQALGIPNVFFQQETWDDILQSIRHLGPLIGREKEAERLTTRMEEKVVAIRKAALAARQKKAETPSPRVVVLLELGTTFAAGPGSFPYQLTTWLGAENIAQTSPVRWPRLDWEFLVQANPEWIIIGEKIHPTESETWETQWKQLKQEKRWKAIEAVEKDQLIVLKEGALTIPGPRIPLALDTIARRLYGSDYISPLH